jgi:hypothetical protein
MRDDLLRPGSLPAGQRFGSYIAWVMLRSSSSSGEPSVQLWAEAPASKGPSESDRRMTKNRVQEICRLAGLSVEVGLPCRRTQTRTAVVGHEGADRPTRFPLADRRTVASRPAQSPWRPLLRRRAKAPGGAIRLR